MRQIMKILGNGKLRLINTVMQNESNIEHASHSVINF